jgi:hypothetical protein
MNFVIIFDHSAGFGQLFGRFLPKLGGAFGCRHFF